MTEEEGRDIGDFIREQRKLAELSVRRLADLAGVSNPYLSQIERGLRRPSAEILQQLAKALQVSAETMFIQAGILDEDAVAPVPTLEEAIRSAPELTEDQRKALLGVYRSFVPAAPAPDPAADADADADADAVPMSMPVRRPMAGRPTPTPAMPSRPMARPPMARRPRTRPPMARRPGMRRPRMRPPDRPEVGRDRPSTEGPDVRRVAILSLHTSPLAQPGTGDGGGMNVYVREFASALAASGLDCRVYVRRWSHDLPAEVHVEPGFQVVHVDAGPVELAKEQLDAHVEAFADGVAEDLATYPADVLHANYWLSGVAGRLLKQRLGLPLVTTFHTLARVKADLGDPEPERRARAEAEVMACADAVLANCTAEAEQLVDYYGADSDRIEIVAPGVDHAFFSPGSQAGARWALQAGDAPLLLFVGRIQPLKGVDVAVETLAALDRTDARLWIVGGASGTGGDGAVRRVRELIGSHGLEQRVRFVPPQPHHLLSTYYRAADVCLVPSRSESFGLVALEAAACGVPTVASAVGGLLTLVEHGFTGYLVEGRDPADYAEHVDRILADPVLARRLALSAAARGRTYTWSRSARRLGRLYAELSSRVPVPCD